MKKIYAGSELAAVVLDTPQEIELVTNALLAVSAVPTQHTDERAAMALYAELIAPAPQ